MVKLYEDTNIKAIADAIRAKNGTTTTYKTSEMAKAIANIATGGGDDTEFIKMVECKSGYTLNIPEGTTQIGLNCFYYDKNIKSIVCPESAKIIYESAFYGCSSLTSAEFKGATDIGKNAFRDCTKLSSLIINACTDISGTYAFRGCTQLTTFNAPAMTYINSYAFHSCTSLTTVNIPNIVELGSNIFEGCTALRNIYIPASCTTIWASGTGASLFKSCSADLHIYCSASAQPENWGEYWNYNASTSGTFNVTWGVTPEQYNSIVNG